MEATSKDADGRIVSVNLIYSSGRISVCNVNAPNDSHITTSPRFKCVIAKLGRLLYFLLEGAILFLWALSSSQFKKCSRITEVASNNFGFTVLIKGEILVRKPLKPIEKTRTKQ